MKRVADEARQMLVKKYRSEFRRYYLEEKEKLSFPSYNTDPVAYYRLHGKVTTKARLRLIGAHHNEFILLKWEIRSNAH